MNFCPLCRLVAYSLKRHIVRKFYYKGDKVIIVNCKTCKVPMVVWREHIEKITPEEKNYVMNKIKELFPKRNYYIDERMRKIPTHKHWHLRPLTNYKKH